MSEPVRIPEASESRRSGNLRRCLAALLSALAPGTGQILLGQRRRGMMLLGVLAIFCLGFWPLRLLRWYWGLVFLGWGLLLLILYATTAALLITSHAERPSKSWGLLSIPLTYVGLDVVFTALLLIAGFRALEFSSNAMEPLLFKGDRFIVDRQYYRVHPCSYDDLVAMRVEEAVTVKRIIALGGDTIQGKDRHVFLNGHLLNEPFADHPRGGGNVPEQDNFGPITVLGGKYFVMGDNRDSSRDSRIPDFGQVEEDAIVGRPLYIYLGHVWSRNGAKLN